MTAWIPDGRGNLSPVDMASFTDLLFGGPDCPDCGGEGWIVDESACSDPEHCAPQVPCAACNPDGRDD